MILNVRIINYMALISVHKKNSIMVFLKGTATIFPLALL